MRFLRRSLTAIFLLCVTIGILAFAANTLRSAVEERRAREARPAVARERVYNVNVTQALPETVVPVLTSYGELRSTRTLDLRASTGGRVIELADAFEEGGKVEAGMLLLRVDPTDFEDALVMAETDLIEAEADRDDAARALDLARDDLASAEKQAGLREQALARQKDLVARGVGTDAAVENATLSAASAEQAVLSRRSALASAQARVKQAENTVARRRIALDEARRRLDETTLYADFSGMLGNVAVVQGGMVSANERVAQLVDPEALEVSFRLSTAQYARLLDGEGRLVKADVTIKLDVAGVDLSAQGRIERESAVVGDGQTGRLLFARLDQVAGLRPGDFVTVEIREPALEGIITLPASAVDAAGNVLVVGENDRLEEAGVELLRRQGDSVLVRAPAIAGREVVSERTPVLGAGIKVRVTRPDAAAATPGAGAPGLPTPQGSGETVTLTPERRAELKAMIEANSFMPADAKARFLNLLDQDEVPAALIERLEGGGSGGFSRGGAGGFQGGMRGNGG